MYFFTCTTTGGNGHRYSDDDSKNDYRKGLFKIGKRIIFDQNRGQKLKLFHGNLEQKWGEYQNKMDGLPFLLSILINETLFVNALYDIGCLFNGIVDSKFVTKFGLKFMKIIFRNMQRHNDSTNGVCNEIILVRFDINKHVEISFYYVVFKLNYNMILKKPWMKKKRCSVPS